MFDDFLFLYDIIFFVFLLFSLTFPITQTAESIGCFRNYHHTQKKYNTFTQRQSSKNYCLFLAIVLPDSVGKKTPKL